MSYVELHFHLLPGVDDGPSTLEGSLALARAAAADGTTLVVATPHINADCVTDPSELPARVGELADHLRRELVPLEVLTGGELAHGMVARLSDAQLGVIAHGPPGRRWVLLEAPFEGFDAGFTAAADELRARGFGIVLAHPERAARGPATAAALEHELAAGSYLQLTAWSFAGLYGDQARALAMRMLLSCDRVLIASDAHGSIRPPALRSALDALDDAGVRDPGRFVEAVPRGLLDDGLVTRRAALVA